MNATGGGAGPAKAGRGGERPADARRSSEGPANARARHVVLVTYGEPPEPWFGAQLKYSWRILLGLTRSVAPIPLVALPMIALARARFRTSLWRTESYRSPLEPLTRTQADALETALRRADSGTQWQVHVAYEFRDPLLPSLLDQLAGRGPVDVAAMYLADSAFTHELTRRCVEAWRARNSGADVRVLPALDSGAIAGVLAGHIEREIEARRLATGPDTALVLAAHGTLLAPPRPIETGRVATESIASEISRRLAPRFGRITLGWLNHVYGGRWTEPPADVALREIEQAGFRNVIYYPFGFLADNAESQLEGRIALRVAPGVKSTHLPCLNSEPGFIQLLARQVLAPRVSSAAHRSVPAAAAPAANGRARSAPAAERTRSAR